MVHYPRVQFYYPVLVKVYTWTLVMIELLWELWSLHSIPLTINTGSLLSLVQVLLPLCYFILILFWHTSLYYHIQFWYPHELSTFKLETYVSFMSPSLQFLTLRVFQFDILYFILNLQYMSYWNRIVFNLLHVAPLSRSSLSLPFILYNKTPRLFPLTTIDYRVIVFWSYPQLTLPLPLTSRLLDTLVLHRPNLSYSNLLTLLLRSSRFLFPPSFFTQVLCLAGYGAQ